MSKLSFALYFTHNAPFYPRPISFPLLDAAMETQYPRYYSCCVMLYCCFLSLIVGDYFYFCLIIQYSPSQYASLQYTITKL